LTFFFKQFVNFILNIFAVRANSKFQFMQQSAKFVPKWLLQNTLPYIILHYSDKYQGKNFNHLIRDKYK